MSSAFYQLLKRFLWPRYREEGPPSYIDNAFYEKDFINSEGKIKEPIKSILDFIVIGYRPITSLSILAILVENQNRPMYGAQLGAELEKRFQLPKGWFTKTRYYDNRIGKLLKIFCRLDILEETEIKDWKTKRRYVGYRIGSNIYPAIKERMLSFLQGGSLSILAPTAPLPMPKEKAEILKRCSSCNALTTSPSAKCCELCGAILKVVCPKCGEEVSLEYSFCRYCGQKLESN